MGGRRWARGRRRAAGELPLPPGKKVAVVACMDARLNPYGLLGLAEGDAHVIHPDCGMLTFTDEQFAELLEASTGQRPTWSAEAFPELEGDVRASIEKMTSSPFIPNQGSVRGFVYDVHSGGLSEVR